MHSRTRILYGLAGVFAATTAIATIWTAIVVTPSQPRLRKFLRCFWGSFDLKNIRKIDALASVVGVLGIITLFWTAILRIQHRESSSQNILSRPSTHFYTLIALLLTWIGLATVLIDQIILLYRTPYDDANCSVYITNACFMPLAGTACSWLLIITCESCCDLINRQADCYFEVSVLVILVFPVYRSGHGFHRVPVGTIHTFSWF